MTSNEAIRHLGAVMGVAALLVVAALPVMRAQQVESRTQDIPAYHSTAPKGALPPVLPAQNFTDPLTKKAYAYAAKMKPVLYQLPCYCHCDQAVGHTSLLSCYRDQHGAECETCKKELFYAYEQSRRGKTAPQIREGIVRGEWQKVDLTRYAPALVSGKQ